MKSMIRYCSLILFAWLFAIPAQARTGFWSAVQKIDTEVVTPVFVNWTALSTLLTGTAQQGQPTTQGVGMALNAPFMNGGENRFYVAGSTSATACTTGINVITAVTVACSAFDPTCAITPSDLTVCPDGKFLIRLRINKVRTVFTNDWTWTTQNTEIVTTYNEYSQLEIGTAVRRELTKFLTGGVKSTSTHSWLTKDLATSTTAADRKAWRFHVRDSSASLEEQLDNGGTDADNIYSQQGGVSTSYIYRRTSNQYYPVAPASWWQNPSYTERLWTQTTLYTSGYGLSAADAETSPSYPYNSVDYVNTLNTGFTILPYTAKYDPNNWTQVLVGTPTSTEVKATSYSGVSAVKPPFRQNGWPDYNQQYLIINQDGSSHVYVGYTYTFTDYYDPYRVIPTGYDYVGTIPWGKFYNNENKNCRPSRIQTDASILDNGEGYLVVAAHIPGCDMVYTGPGDTLVPSGEHSDSISVAFLKLNHYNLSASDHTGDWIVRKLRLYSAPTTPVTNRQFLAFSDLSLSCGSNQIPWWLPTQYLQYCHVAFVDGWGDIRVSDIQPVVQGYFNDQSVTMGTPVLVGGNTYVRPRLAGTVSPINWGLGSIPYMDQVMTVVGTDNYIYMNWRATTYSNGAWMGWSAIPGFNWTIGMAARDAPIFATAQEGIWNGSHYEMFWTGRCLSPGCAP